MMCAGLILMQESVKSMLTYFWLGISFSLLKNRTPFPTIVWHNLCEIVSFIL